MIYTLADLTRVLLSAGFRPPWTQPALRDDDDDWLIRPAAWDSHGKHNSPLNHLRFYIPHFPFLAGVERVLFVDDDILVNRDIAAALHHAVQPGMAMVTSCAISSYLKDCDAFELRAGEFSYAQTPFFGFKAYNLNGLLQNDVFCSDKLTDECIRRPGLDIIQREARRINGKEVDFERLKAWNYGYTLIHTSTWLELSLTKRYELWIEANTRNKIVPSYSLGYGLGLAYLAMAGTVQCYDPNVVRVMEGMAFLDRFDLLANNITEADVDQSTYIHFNGDRKPWHGSAFDEWRSRYENANVHFDFASRRRRQRKQLFVLLSGPREGTEWVMSSLDQSPEVCATGEAADSSRGFPSELFIPQSTILGGKSSRHHRCSRKAVCTWRNFVSILDKTTTQQYRYGSVVEPWRVWWEGEANRNATLLFKTFVLALLTDPDHLERHPYLVLPCRCKDSANFIGFKWFHGWSSRDGKHTHNALSYYGDHGIPVLDSLYEIHIHALRVFHELGAKFIWWKREDIAAAFASLQNAKASNVFHCRGGDNCTRVAAKIDAEQSAIFVQRTQEERAFMQRKMQELDIQPVVVSYEECVRSNEKCAMKVQEALGLNAPNPALLATSVVKKYETVGAS